MDWALPTMKPEGNNNASKANNSASEAAEKCCPEEGTTCCCEPEVEEKIDFSKVEICGSMPVGLLYNNESEFDGGYQYDLLRQ